MKNIRKVGIHPNKVNIFKKVILVGVLSAITASIGFKNAIIKIDNDIPILHTLVPVKSNPYIVYPSEPKTSLYKLTK